jgi:SAM-dependent methyltransferase
MPIYTNVPPIPYYPNPEGFLRKIHEPLGVSSVLDIGAGHGGTFDGGYWNPKPVLKVAADMFFVRPTDPTWRIDLGIDCTKLSDHYAPGSFDLVQCLETLEHIPKNREALEEMCKVARKLVFITSCDEGHHAGPLYDESVRRNPYNAYTGQPLIEDLLDLGFHTHVEHFECRQIVAWKIIGEDYKQGTYPKTTFKPEITK